MSIHWLTRRLFRKALSPRGPRRAGERFAPHVLTLEDRTTPAYTATLAGTTATFTGDGTSETITFSQSGGNLTHNLVGGGFVDQFDFDSTNGVSDPLPASAASTVNVNTGGGNDTVNIGTAAVAASTLLAEFIVDNAGQDGDTLLVDDSASTTSTTYTETSIRITATGINVRRASDGFSGGVELRTGSGNDTVNLTSVASVGTFIEPVRFFTNGGDDTININPSSGSLDTFGQAISVDAGAGTSDALFINDVSDGSVNTYTITAADVQRTGGIDIDYDATTEIVRLDAGTGSDSLILDYNGAALTAEFNLAGGTGTDSLTLQDGTFGILTHTYFNATTGSSQITGQPLVGYSGTESIADNLTITGRIFNFSNSGDTVTVGDDTGAVAGLAQISSTSTSPQTTFTNPGSLTIRLDGGGGGNDSLTLNAFDAGFNANILVNSGDGNDTLTLNATSGTTAAYNLFGDAGNDSLTIDYTLGDIDRLISFNGGTGGNDSLTLRNGTVASVTHTFTSATDGNVLVAANPLIQYTGLDPISDTLVATNRTFTFANGDDVVTLADDTGLVAGVSQISSASTSETVTFANPTGTLTVNLDNGGTGDDSLTVNALDAAFAAPITVNGGDGNDTLALGNAVTLFGGTFDGGAGTDTLNYSAYTTGVSVNLGLNVTGLTATPGGDQTVPTSPSPATGTVTFSNYNLAAKTFDISGSVSGLLPADVTALRIFVGGVGVNGTAIIDLSAVPRTPDGMGGFTFTAAGVALPALREAAFLGGQTYLRIDTAALPNGAVRGQIFSTGNVAAASGTATGIGTLMNVENATGGGGDDSLVGSMGVNTLSGNAGNDTLVGGPGADVFSGGANDDTLVWSNGDGSDVMNGDGGTDTVAVNGNVTAGDVFTVGAGAGGRVAFARTSAGPFTLDIGTTEGLTVNGVGGDDSFTVNALTGVTNLAQIRLNGFAGSDLFTVTPDANVAVTVGGGNPTPPAAPGDALIVNTAGTAAPTLTSTTVAGGVAGAYTFGDRQAVAFFQVETLFPTNAAFTSANAFTFAQGVQGTFTVTATGNPAPTFSITAGALPAGVTLNGTTGVLSGTPTVSGVFNVTITAANGLNPNATQAFTLTVTAAPLPPAPPPPPAMSPPPPAMSPPPPAMTPPPPAVAEPIVLGRPGSVIVLNPVTGQQTNLAAPFGAIPANVAVGDLTGDGVPDFALVPGQGGGPVLNLVDGASGSTIVSLLALPGADFRGGLSVAVGTGVTGPGSTGPVVAVGAGVGGGPFIRVFDARTLRVVAEFFAFSPALRTGVTVALADVTGDGVDDLIVGTGPNVAAQVEVIDGTKFGMTVGGVIDPAALVAPAFAPFLGFTGGVFVAAGNLDGDAFADVVVTAGVGGGPAYATYFGKDLVARNTSAPVVRPGLPDGSFRGGLEVAVTDVNSDGKEDVVLTPGPGGGPVVLGFDGVTGSQLLGVFVGNPTDRNGGGSLA